MNLETALATIEIEILHSNYGVLNHHSLEDTIGGYHPDPEFRKWPIGSMFEVEGKVLYALICALKPKHILELGRRFGCSTTHIATALAKNGAGKVVSVDSNIHGYTELMIPEPLYSRIELVNTDALEYLKTHKNKFDIIFEDLDHDRHVTAAVAQDAKSGRLKAGGLLIVHDTMHFLVGEALRAGLQDAGIEAQHYLIEPSDCGFGIWRRPV